MSKPNETDVSETTESSNCEFSLVSEQNSPENLCKRDGDKFIKMECQPKSLEFKESFANTSTPIQNAPDVRENVKLITKHSILDLISNDSFKKLDSSSESEKSRENESKSFNFYNFTNMIYNRRGEASTGSDTSDSSFENLKSKRKIFRKPFEIEKYRRGIFERNRITESSNNENIFPICYPLPKFDGRKKLAIDTKSVLADCFDYFHNVDGKKKIEKVSHYFLFSFFFWYHTLLLCRELCLGIVPQVLKSTIIPISDVKYFIPANHSLGGEFPFYICCSIPFSNFFLNFMSRTLLKSI